MIWADVLCTPGERTRYAYFPTEGFISLLTLTGGSPELEVGMVGREGMLGAQIVLGWAQRPCVRLCKVRGRHGASTRVPSARSSNAARPCSAC
ncbi:UNVERIFIED_ORG: hypothetical protein J2W38_007453 [Variovorax paradoxus]|nr:hypothetical protein [Variovorax paradoxus]